MGLLKKVASSVSSAVKSPVETAVKTAGFIPKTTTDLGMKLPLFPEIYNSLNDATGGKLQTLYNASAGDLKAAKEVGQTAIAAYGAPGLGDLGISIPQGFTDFLNKMKGLAVPTAGATISGSELSTTTGYTPQPKNNNNLPWIILGVVGVTGIMYLLIRRK